MIRYLVFFLFIFFIDYRSLVTVSQRENPLFAWILEDLNLLAKKYVMKLKNTCTKNCKSWSTRLICTLQITSPRYICTPCLAVFHFVQGIFMPGVLFTAREMTSKITLGNFVTRSWRLNTWSLFYLWGVLVPKNVIIERWTKFLQILFVKSIEITFVFQFWPNKRKKSS